MALYNCRQGHDAGGDQWVETWQAWDRAMFPFPGFLFFNQYQFKMPQTKNMMEKKGEM